MGRIGKDTMPKGVHTSVRVAMAVPPKLHEQLAQWAEYEGRPVASLCLFLVEQGLRQAQIDGYAPSYSNPELLQGDTRWKKTTTYKKGAVVEESTPPKLSPEEEKLSIMQGMVVNIMARKDIGAAEKQKLIEQLYATMGYGATMTMV